jgi:N-methylhydantoinase A/oxoprolinase/acetone carboxylase beta subunit
MVEAIDAHTAGLGGDSHVWLDAAQHLNVGPRRVLPLCLMADQFPRAIARLDDTFADAERLPCGEFLMLQNWARASAHDGAHPPFEEELYARLRQGPCAIEEVERIVVYPQLHAAYLNMLERQGLVIRAGVTPTDAAHGLGLYVAWNVAASRWGLRLLALRLGQADGAAVARQIVQRTAEQISMQVASKLLADDGVNGHHSDLLSQALIARALRPSAADRLGVELCVRPVLVAIGAPVHTYLPLAAELLHGQLVIPEHSEVANALGAVVGSVVARVHALVAPTDEQDYRVHLPDRVYTAMTLDEAVEIAEREGRHCAIERATLAGAADIHVSVQRVDHTAPVAHSLGEMLLVQTVVEVHAVGRPRLARDGA